MDNGAWNIALAYLVIVYGFLLFACHQNPANVDNGFVDAYLRICLIDITLITDHSTPCDICLDEVSIGSHRIWSMDETITVSKVSAFVSMNDAVVAMMRQNSDHVMAM
eukprot:102645_1